MLDYLGVLGALNRAGVRYVVVGGVAVNLHGIPRMTYDLDLVVALEEENLARLLALLQEWAFRPRAPVALSDLMQERMRSDWIENKGMKAFCVTNSAWALSEIDILIDSPVSFHQAFRNAERMRIGGEVIPVAAIPDLITMKQGTGRAQDEADIRYLKETQIERAQDEE